MQITMFSVLTTVTWSSVLIILFYILRKKSILLDVCSVSGVIVLYLFCIIRMFVPVELPWTKVFHGGALYNIASKILLKEIYLGIEFRIYYLLLMFWIAGIVVFMVDYWMQYAKLCKIFRNIPAVSDEVTEKVIDRIYGNAGRKPQVCRTPLVKTPCCTGVFQKKILLPEKDYDEESLYYILLHECSHLKNNDILTKMLTSILCAFYWWNPVTYLLKKDLNQSMEIRCDGLAVQDMDAKACAVYLQAILQEFKDSVPENNRLDNYSAGFMRFAADQSDKLVERFYIVKDRRGRQSKAGIVFTSILAIVLLVVSYSFVIQPLYDEVPAVDIKGEYDGVELDSENSYIIKKDDCSYYLHFSGGEYQIQPENVELMIREGMEVREGEE